MRDQSTAKKPRGRASKTQRRTSIPVTPDAAAPRATPAITTALRRGARQRRSGVPNQQQEELLPPELLQLVGGTLSSQDMAAASLVCKLWSRSLRGGKGKGWLGRDRCCEQLTTMRVWKYRDATACMRATTIIIDTTGTITKKAADWSSVSPWAAAACSHLSRTYFPCSPPPTPPPPSPGITSLTTHLQPDATANAEKAAALANALPLLARLHVHFGARCDTAALLPFFSSVKGLARLRDLRLTSWVPYAPQKGAGPIGSFGSLELGGVTSLVVDGSPLSTTEMLVRWWLWLGGWLVWLLGLGSENLSMPRTARPPTLIPPNPKPTPPKPAPPKTTHTTTTTRTTTTTHRPQGVINSAATAENLASLSLLPNVWPYFTQLDPFQVPAWLQPANTTFFTGTPRMPSTTAATLLACKVPGLQHLVIANDVGSQTDFFSQLQGLSALSSLDLLTGSAVASKPLQVRVCFLVVMGLCYGSQLWLARLVCINHYHSCMFNHQLAAARLSNPPLTPPPPVIITPTPSWSGPLRPHRTAWAAPAAGAGGVGARGPWGALAAGADAAETTGGQVRVCCCCCALVRLRLACDRFESDSSLLCDPSSDFPTPLLVHLSPITPHPPLHTPLPHDQTTTRLYRRTAEPLCRDLTALTRRRAAPALVELELSKCVWSAEAGACIAALTSLTRLRLERLECVRPARASASASRAAMSVDLQPLMALRGMRRFELVAATGSVAGVLQVGLSLC